MPYAISPHSLVLAGSHRYLPQIGNLILVNGMLEMEDDLDLRIHLRTQMEASGLQRIIALCQSFCVPPIDIQLDKLQKVLDEDEQKFQERLDQEILRDFTDPQDIFNAIRAKTQDSRAAKYFLSMMQHLLLIREEDQALVSYYRLLDSLVTDVVLDKKLAGAEQKLGQSVERIIAQFNEADRYQVIEDEAAEARSQALRLKLEKETLEEEIAQGQDGLVGRLKLQVVELEKTAKTARDSVTKLQGQLETQKAGYEEQITQLEAQIMELFKMLKEVGKGVDHILDTGTLDRQSLVQSLEKHFQRSRTISILEGRDRLGRKKSKMGNGEKAEDGDTDVTPKKSSLRRGSKSVAKKGNKVPAVPGPRTSQFMDADETAVQEQMKQQLAAGVKVVSAQFS
jgi:cytokinesis protein